MTFREYPPKGLSGSRVRVMATEMFTGPASSRACGDCVDVLAWPLVTVLSRAVVSFVRCFNVSFSETHKSKSLNRRRKVFQSFGKTKENKGESSASAAGAAAQSRPSAWCRTRPAAPRSVLQTTGGHSLQLPALPSLCGIQTLSHSKSKI